MPAELRASCVPAAGFRAVGRAAYTRGGGQNCAWAVPTESSVQAVLDYRKPTSRSEVRRFLGLTGYLRHLIPNYAVRAAPLSALTSELGRVQVDERLLVQLQRSEAGYIFVPSGATGRCTVLCS